MAGPSTALVVALVVLLTSLAALVLANSLRSQLQETQGQLEEVHGQLRDSQSELQEMQQAKDRQQKIQEAKDRQQKTAKGSAGPAESRSSTVNKSQPQDNAKDRSQTDTKDSTREGQEEQDAQGQQVATVALIQVAGGSSLSYLLLVALGLAVLASLVLVVISALGVLSGSSSGRPEAGFGGSVPSDSGTSNLESASPLEDPLGNPLEDGRWMKLVEECVEVIDELDEHLDTFDAPRREVAEHVILRLEEILGRSGVQIISNDKVFDRTRHKPDMDHGVLDNGATVSETLSPGFAVGPRVLRRARVRLK